LEKLPGWSWDPSAEAWDAGFQHLEVFAELAGHCKVARNYVATDGYRLGQWINSQRTKRESLLGIRVAKLESLPGWTWNAVEDRWMEQYSELRAFADREGHCIVPQRGKEGTRDPLGQWVSEQRSSRGRSRIPPDRKSLLESLPGWLWQLSGNDK
jgi:hypothetical protein